MNKTCIGIKRAQIAVRFCWLAFGVSIAVTLLVTIAMWFYSELPALIEDLANEDPAFSMLTFDMIDPAFINALFSIVWGLIAFAAFFCIIAVIFWWRWLSLFINARSSTRMSGGVAALSSLIPVFGIFVQYFVLKDALSVLEFELMERGQTLTKSPFSLMLWFFTAIVFVLFVSFSHFDYWIFVLLAEFLGFLAFFRYIRLISALKHEEEKLM